MEILNLVYCYLFFVRFLGGDTGNLYRNGFCKESMSVPFSSFPWILASPESGHILSNGFRHLFGATFLLKMTETSPQIYTSYNITWFQYIHRSRYDNGTLSPQTKCRTERRLHAFKFSDGYKSTMDWCSVYLTPQYTSPWMGFKLTT
jgi:hypothetical protein